MDWHFSADVELNSPLIGALVGGTRLLNTWAVGIRVGAERERVGMYAFLERSHLEEPSYNDDVSNDLISFGGAGWVSYFENRMRSMILLGTTILMTESFQNPQGTMGLYSELRPAGFVFHIGKANIQLYPITLCWLVPVLQNVPLFYLHYRTAVSLGGTF
ncbi:MAG: hypothetical protein JXR76_32370 [Deltaproteobacteria bacterium]|nr:hypothetical protein [Deltaproteobacteria bacterium]